MNDFFFLELFMNILNILLSWKLLKKYNKNVKYKKVICPPSEQEIKCYLALNNSKNKNIKILIYWDDYKNI